MVGGMLIAVIVLALMVLVLGKGVLVG